MDDNLERALNDELGIDDTRALSDLVDKIKELNEKTLQLEKAVSEHRKTVSEFGNKVAELDKSISELEDTVISVNNKKSISRYLFISTITDWVGIVFLVSVVVAILIKVFG